MASLKYKKKRLEKEYRKLRMAACRKDTDLDLESQSYHDLHQKLDKLVRVIEYADEGKDGTL